MRQVYMAPNLGRVDRHGGGRTRDQKQDCRAPCEAEHRLPLTSRILIEAGLSECPFGTGETPADIDLSRLMAKASMIFYLGGYSDAIHYGGMKPEGRISPAGQVLIDPAFFDVIVEPAGRSLADKVIDEHRDRYTELLREPDLETRPLGEIVEGEFLEAWEG